MTRLFEKTGSLDLRSGAPRVLVVDSLRYGKYSHIFGAGDVLARFLECSGVDVVRFGTGLGRMRNCYEMRGDFSDALLRKKQEPEHYLELNASAIDEALDAALSECGPFDAALISTSELSHLPMREYVSRGHALHGMSNEFHDYVGEDPKLLDAIRDVNESVVGDWHRKVSPIAFSTKRFNYFFSLLRRAHDTGALRGKVHALVIDPMFYHPFFSLSGIPLEMHYFEDDRRGTRNFRKFPLAQLQHIVYDSRFGLRGAPYSADRPNDFFFGGTMFIDKGDRKRVWDAFFRDLDLPRSHLYIPRCKNGVKKAGRESEKAESATREKYGEWYDEVVGHPMYRGSLTAEAFNRALSGYKYGFVAKCQPHYDSLNFRPLAYAVKGLLPLFDEAYDPECLQIPREFQDALACGSSRDIEERVKHFNAHPEDARRWILRLRELLEVDKFSNSGEVSSYLTWFAKERMGFDV